MKLKTTVNVPGKGRFACATPLDGAVDSEWKRDWSRPEHPSFGKILGQHLYALRVDDTAILCKVRWSNGAVMPDGTGFCGKVYFNHLAVELDDPEWTIVALPANGERLAEDPATQTTTWTIASRTTHVALPRDISEREFVVVRRGRQARGLALLRRQQAFPTFAPRGKILGPGYGPMRTRLPAVNQAQYESVWTNHANALENAVGHGTTFYLQDLAVLTTGTIGIKHPQGADTAYSQGGLDIDPYTGFEQCSAGRRFNALMHRLTMDRSPMALYRADTGEILRQDEWANAGLARPQLMKGETGEFKDQLELPAFLVGDYNTYRHRVFNPGNSCAFEQTLAKFKLPDVAHSRRISVNAEPLAEHEGCPMAIDDMHLLFEYSRHGAFSNRRDEQLFPAYQGQYVPPSLTRALFSLRTPGGAGNGAGFDRAFGWTLFHEALVERHIPRATAAMDSASQWAIDARECYMLAADRDTGLVQRDGPRPELPPGVQATQVFHSAILALGAIAQVRTNLSPGDPGLISLKLALTNLVQSLLGSATLVMIDDPYQSVSYGPPHWVWTYLRNGLNWQRIFPLTNATSTGAGDPVHWQAVIAEVWRIVGDPKILELGLGLTMPVSTLQQRLAMLNSPSFPLAARAQTAGYEAALEEHLA
jgi:hypothetical protein